MKTIYKTHMHSIFKSVFILSVLAVGLLSLTVISSNATEGLNSAPPLLEHFDKGYINWKSGEYIANVSAPVPSVYRGKAVNKAMGKELALRVSRALANSVFLQIVADTRVDSKHRLSQIVKDNAEIKLAGNIRGKKLIKTKWVNKNDKLWLDASYRISMRGVGGVISNIYKQAIKSRINNQPATAKVPAATSHVSANVQPVVYIDARGTRLQPALFPVIMDQSGTPFLEPADMGKSYISANGMLEYVVAEPEQSLSISSLKWLIQASNAEERVVVRKRRKRRVMKATEAGGPLRSNIIVGKEDAERMRKAQASGELSTHPRIIVITDGTVGGTEGRLTIPGNFWVQLSPEKYDYSSKYMINTNGN